MTFLRSPIIGTENDQQGEKEKGLAVQCRCSRCMSFGIVIATVAGAVYEYGIEGLFLALASAKAQNVTVIVDRSMKDDLKNYEIVDDYDFASHVALFTQGGIVVGSLMSCYGNVVNVCVNDKITLPINIKEPMGLAVFMRNKRIIDEKRVKDIQKKKKKLPS